MEFTNSVDRVQQLEAENNLLKLANQKLSDQVASLLAQLNPQAHSRFVRPVVQSTYFYHHFFLIFSNRRP